MILVAGATGMLGGMIARQLLAQGSEVRILVRPGSSYQPLVAAGAQPVEGDLKDPASLASACAGVEAVITTANSAGRGGADNPETVEREGNRNLIDAARAAGVRRFVFVSVLGASEESPVPFIQGKAHTEAHLRASGLPHTILAPNFFMELWMPMMIGGPVRAGKLVTLVGEGRRKHTFVSAGDVAAFAVAAVGHPAAVDRHLPIGGPEALSWRDAVGVFERVLGRAIPVRTIAPGELLPDLPPVSGLPEFVSGMMAATETYDTPIDMAAAVGTFGVRQIPLEEYVRREFGGAADAR